MLHGRSLVIGFLLGIGCVIPVLYVRDTAQTAAIHRFRREADSAKAVRHVVIESVTVHAPAVAAAKAASDRLGVLVRLVGPTSVAIRTTPDATPVRYEVPAQVVLRMRADSVTIAEQAAQLARQAAVIAADSVVIAKQDSLIAAYVVQAKGRRCGPKCGGAIVLGVMALLKLGLGLL